MWEICATTFRKAGYHWGTDEDVAALAEVLDIGFVVFVATPLQRGLVTAPVIFVSACVGMLHAGGQQLWIYTLPLDRRTSDFKHFMLLAHENGVHFQLAELGCAKWPTPQQCFHPRRCPSSVMTGAPCASTRAVYF